MGLAPELLPLWIAHEVAHALRYTSPSSRAAMRRLVSELGRRLLRRLGDGFARELARAGGE